MAANCAHEVILANSATSSVVTDRFEIVVMLVFISVFVF